MSKARKGSGLGASMAGGNPDAERGRQDLDFYPTPADVTRALIGHYPAFIDMLVWEPCCGDGSMVAALNDSGVRRVVTSDIKEYPQVRPHFKPLIANFFDVPVLPAGVDAIITNPPFEIAVPFIEHAMNFRPRYLALVLKSSFWHASSRLPLFQKYPPGWIHPLTWRPDFQGLGRPTMEIMWCIWGPDSYARRSVTQTKYIPLARPQ